MQPAEHDRCGQRKLAPRRAVLAQQAPLGLVDVRDHPAAGLEVAPAGLGEREAPRGPGDQPDADVLLEPHHLAAHGGQRRAETAGGGGQAAGVGNLDEHPHGVQAVQGSILPFFGMISFMFSGFLPRMTESISKPRPPWP